MTEANAKCRSFDSGFAVAQDDTFPGRAMPSLRMTGFLDEIELEDAEAKGWFFSTGWRIGLRD